MKDIQKELLNKNIIVISGNVDSAMVSEVSEAFTHLRLKDNPDIEILINSNGGDVEWGLTIYDIIDTYKGKTTGIVHSSAYSMGAIILQACTVRKATRHSYILIHHISRQSVSLDVLKDPAKRRRTIEQMEKPQRRLYEILLKRTKKPLDEIISTCKKDTKMSAEEALAFGLIGEIIPSEPKED